MIVSKVGLLRDWLRSNRQDDPKKAALKRIREMNREQLIAALDSYVWWHSIDLGGGITTPGHKTREIMESEFASVFSAVDLANKSVLDIGAWNGGFAVEAVRRGASRVVALDHYTWNHEHLKGRESFELVCRAAGVSVEAVDIDLDGAQLNLAHLGKFDVVLFLGVFYHLLNPVAALSQIASLSRELLIVETHVECTADPRPLMIFYPTGELAGDSTNWWGPNTACMVELLKTVGFDRIDVSPGSDPSRQVFHAHRSA